MSVGQYPITVEQGATWVRTVTVEDDGVGRDLTGYDIRMQVRARHSSTDTILSLTSDPAAGIAITDAANGVFTLTLTAAQTAALAVINGAVYDLELVDGSGIVTRLLEGSFTVRAEVTR